MLNITGQDELSFVSRESGTWIRRETTLSFSFVFISSFIFKFEICQSVFFAIIYSPVF